MFNSEIQQKGTQNMNGVSLFRLYLLRGVYLFIVMGLLIEVWPGILHHDKPWELMEGVVNCILVAFSLLCALGLRYPLQMLPILMWEMLWKAIWLLIVALPLWSAGQMDEATLNIAISCLVVVIVPIGVPWRYVIANYVKKQGNRWR